MTPTPKHRPPPKTRSSGCWHITCATLFIATALSLIAIMLPPISLADRLLALTYSPLTLDSPTLAFAELRVSLPAAASPTDFALRLARLDPAESDLSEQPAWLGAAQSALPPALTLQSALYLLEARGSAPTRLHIELNTPGADRLSLYGWDGGAWRFIPARAGADFLPLAVAAFKPAAPAPLVLVTQEVAQDLDSEITDLATILSPAGLVPTASGSLMGSLAPGGSANADYLFMPLIRNFAEPGAIDSGTVAALLSNPPLRAAHIKQISDLTSFNQFAGVFIDYRGLSAALRAPFAQFISELADSLREQGLRLGVVIPAEFDGDGWQAPAHDWAAIGAAVDYFQLRPLIKPPAFAPDAPGSVDDLLAYATGLVEPGKILLGLSASSVREVAGAWQPIGWHEAFAGLGDVQLKAAFSDAGTIEPGAEIRARLEGPPARLGYDDSSHISTLDYLAADGAMLARIWLTDAAALRYRLERGRPYAIGGIAFDDLLAGGRNDRLPAVIRDFKTGQPASVPASKSQFSARWTIDGADGPRDQVFTSLEAELALTLAAPDGNYALNWSVVNAAGEGSARRGAAIPLFRPTATPTPSPTPRPVVAPALGAPSVNYGAGPPPPGSISIEIGGHVTSAGSARALQAMRSAGMTWMKKQERFTWDNPPDVAPVISSAHSNGFKILIGTVGNPAELARGGEAYINAYADWLQRIAGQGADAIEVWNEPNLDREWPRGQISGSAYAGMLAAAYQKIKQVNPGTMVISAAPAPTGVAHIPDQVMPDNQWLRQMVEGGGLNYLDCVGAHYNEGIIPPSQTSGDPRGDNYYTRYFYGMLNGYISITRRPICFTELGYLTADGLPPLSDYFSWAQGVTVQQQAAWLAQAAALASQSGQVRLFIVWNVDFTHYGADPQAGYAMLRPDGSCPACAALAAAR